MAWEKLVTKKATVHDTVMLIVKTINDYSQSADVKKITKLLNPQADSLQGFLQRVFWFACYNTNYERDPEGHERIFTPDRILREIKENGKSFIDCKKYTTIIGAILTQAKINILLKVISYDAQKWEHIFIIVPLKQGGYVTLDPVNNCKYNAEIPHKRGYIYFLNGAHMSDTKLSLLGNRNMNKFNLRDSINDSAASIMGNMQACVSGADEEYLMSFSESEVSGIGRKSKAERQAKRKEIFKKVVTVVKKGAAAPLRGAFLGLLLLGKVLENTPLKIHLAKKLAMQWQQDKGAKLSKMWTSFGGNPKELKAAIIKGSGVQLSGYDEGILSGVGVVTIATASSALALALPLIAAAMKILKDSGIIKSGSPEAVATDTAIEEAEDATPAEPASSTTTPASSTTTPAAGSFAAGTIENIPDFLNFIKAVFIFNIGAQFHPGLIIPTSIATIAVFIYSLRKLIFKKIKPWQNFS